jgi:hypothetical protein
MLAGTTMPMRAAKTYGGAQDRNTGSANDARFTRIAVTRAAPGDDLQFRPPSEARNLRRERVKLRGLPFEGVSDRPPPSRMSGDVRLRKISIVGARLPWVTAP